MKVYQSYLLLSLPALTYHRALYQRMYLNYNDVLTFRSLCFLSPVVIFSSRSWNQSIHIQTSSLPPSLVRRERNQLPFKRTWKERIHSVQQQRWLVATEVVRSQGTNFLLFICLLKKFVDFLSNSSLCIEISSCTGITEKLSFLHWFAFALLM